MARQAAMSQSDGSPSASGALDTTHETRAGATRAGAAHPAELKQLRSASPEATKQFGALLGQALEGGDVVLLTGALGAGKTAFTQGIGAGLGVRETINSPTFTLVKEYAGRLPLYHFDLYRIAEPEELYALGFEEYFGGNGVAVIEWAERGEDAQGTVWPPSWLRVELRADTSQPHSRTLDVSAQGARGQALLTDFLAAIQASGRASAGGAGGSHGSSKSMDADDAAGEGA